MIKTNLRDMPVLYIHIEPQDKQLLKDEAKKRGLQLTSYCRMVLLQSINQDKPSS
jgi:hypothetical protein